MLKFGINWDVFPNCNKWEVRDPLLTDPGDDCLLGEHPKLKSKGFKVGKMAPQKKCHETALLHPIPTSHTNGHLRKQLVTSPFGKHLQKNVYIYIYTAISKTLEQFIKIIPQDPECFVQSCPEKFWVDVPLIRSQKLVSVHSYSPWFFACCQGDLEDLASQPNRQPSESATWKAQKGPLWRQRSKATRICKYALT